MTDTLTISNPPAETVPLPELPDDFFRDIKPKDNRSWEFKRSTMRGMVWYDSIIDDILAHPGTSLKETAARLNRAPNTIYLIVGSDLFKARWAQRRAKYNDDLDLRLTGKIAKLAEITLDATIAAVEAKRESMPIQHLKDIGKDALDRLGYGAPRSEASPGVHVHVNNNASAVAATQVSGESLARAREAMRQLNSMQIEASPQRVEGSVVEKEEGQ